MSLTYEGLFDAVRTRCPGIEKPLFEEDDRWPDEVAPPHIVFADVVTPYLEQAVEDGDDARVLIVIHLLEEMLQDPGSGMGGVVRDSVLEVMVARPEILSQVREKFGPLTSATLHDIETWRPSFDPGGGG